MSRPFHFKQFSIFQEHAAMKVGTDGVLLGAWAEKDNAKKILDIGCGTGLITLMLAQRFPAAEILAIDIESSAIEDSEFNCKNSPWADRIIVEQTAILELKKKSFDLIVSNPPFFESDTPSPIENRARARSGLSLSFISWIEKVKELLNEEGSFAFIYPIEAYRNLEDSIQDLGFHLQRYREIKPVEEKAPHRVLIQIGLKEVDLQREDDLVIEISRHKYTEAYKELTRDFYLKAD